MLDETVTTNYMFFFFFFNDTATTEIYTLSLHDALRSFTVVGDGDSLSKDLKAQLNFIHVTEQEDNDLTKATRHYASLAGTKPGSRVAFLAATGKREDHTLANISLLLRYYREFNLQLG